MRTCTMSCAVSMCIYTTEYLGTTPPLHSPQIVKHPVSTFEFYLMHRFGIGCEDKPEFSCRMEEKGRDLVPQKFFFSFHSLVMAACFPIHHYKKTIVCRPHIMWGAWSTGIQGWRPLPKRRPVVQVYVLYSRLHFIISADQDFFCSVCGSLEKNLMYGKANFMDIISINSSTWSTVRRMASRSTPILKW